jgi:hypothetical protein
VLPGVRELEIGCGRLRERGLDDRGDIIQSAREGVRVAQVRGSFRRPKVEIGRAAESEPALEERDRALEISALEVCDPEEVSVHQGERLIDGLGNSERFRTDGDRLVEPAQLGETPALERQGTLRGQPRLAEPLVGAIGQQLDDLPELLDGRPIVAAAVVGDANEEPGHDGQTEITTPARELERALA